MGSFRTAKKNDYEPTFSVFAADAGSEDSDDELAKGLRIMMVKGEPLENIPLGLLELEFMN